MNVQILVQSGDSQTWSQYTIFTAYTAIWTFKEAALKTSYKAKEIRFRKANVTHFPSYVEPRIDINI